MKTVLIIIVDLHIPLHHNYQDWVHPRTQHFLPITLYLIFSFTPLKKTLLVWTCTYISILNRLCRERDKTCRTLTGTRVCSTAPQSQHTKLFIIRCYRHFKRPEWDLNWFSHRNQSTLSHVRGAVIALFGIFSRAAEQMDYKLGSILADHWLGGSKPWIDKHIRNFKATNTTRPKNCALKKTEFAYRGLPAQNPSWGDNGHAPHGTSEAETYINPINGALIIYSLH